MSRRFQGPNAIICAGWAIVGLLLYSAAVRATENDSLIGKPVIGRNADGHLEVFKVDEDGELRHRWQKLSNGDWSAWSSLGGKFLPSRVILAGPLTLLGDSLLEPLRASVKEVLCDYEADIPVILNSTMGEFNGALGAAALAVHQWKPARDRAPRKLGALA
jgi:hypothetical protein